MTIVMKLIFSVLLIITIGDATRADIINQTKLIPARIGDVIETVGVAIQERAEL